MADDQPNQQVGITEDNDQYFKVRQADGNELTFVKVPGNMGTYLNFKNFSPGGSADNAPSDTPPPAPIVPDLMQGTTPPSNANTPPPLLAAPVPAPQPTPSPVPGDELNRGIPSPPMVSPPQQPTENNMHTTQSSDTTQTAKGIGPIGAALLGQSTVSDQKAIEATNQGLQAKAKEDQLQSNIKYEQLQAQEDDYKKRQQIAQKQTEKMRSDMDTIGRRYNEMTIDSNRLFGDNETGNRILGALALGLGSIATGFSGHDYLTTINGIIESAIKRDIDVQKTNKENVKNEYEMKRGGYQDFLQATKDDNLATQAEYARELEKASSFFGASAERLKLQDPQRAAQVAQLKADMDNKLAVANAGIDSTMLTKQTQVKTAPMESSPQPVQDKVQGLLKENEGLSRIKDLYDALKERGDSTGPLSGRLLQLKSQLGTTSADEGEFLQRIQKNLLEVGHSLGGARAANPSEAEIIKKSSLNQLLSQPAFERILNSSYQDNQNEIAATAAGERASNRFMPIQSWQQYYQADRNDHRDPSTYFHMSFTPKPAAK